MYDREVRHKALALMERGQSLRSDEPGKKHTRTIELEPSQRIITGQHPGSFARGLFHSDGCRFLSRVRRPLAEGGRWCVYPRYMFTNESQDILGLCGETLDQLGVSWRFSRRNTISVARRDAVARLDQFVGPKYSLVGW